MSLLLCNSNEWLFRKEFIEENDGAKGKLYRCKSIWFLEDLGHATKLDRRVTSTASVFFHRFFLFHAFTTHDRFQVAVACLFLAAKVEESAVRLKDIVRRYYEIRHSGNFPDEKTIGEFQKCIILVERLILNTLNFDLYVVHPNISGKFKDLKNYIPDERKHDALQTAVNFVNDSYRSTLCLQYQPQQIAIAMLYLTMVVLAIKPVTRSNVYSDISWINLVEKEIDQITLRNICFEILDLYELTADKALKIKDKNFIKDQIRSDLSQVDEQQLASSSQLSDAMTSTALSPTHFSDQEAEDQKYEEETDEFHIRRQTKVTVTHVRQNSESSMMNYPLGQVPPSESPANGSESVYSTMSSSQAGGYQNQYEYIHEEAETPMITTADTPVEGGNSIYHAFLQEDNNPSDTPSFQDLPRLAARERSQSISDASYQESHKRPRLE